MGTLIDGDDGGPAEEVGIWAKEKHDYLCRYVDIARGVRSGWIGVGKAGATYIDLFCGPGRCRVRDDNTLLTIISDQRENPFIVMETTESLDADWEATAEVLNKNDSVRELLGGW